MTSPNADDTKENKRLEVEENEYLSSKDPSSDLYMSRTELLLKCHTCTQSFSNQSAFTRHTNTDNKRKETKFVCLECDKAFHRASHLRDHDRMYNNIISFECKLCEKIFVRNHSPEMKV